MNLQFEQSSTEALVKLFKIYTNKAQINHINSLQNSTKPGHSLLEGQYLTSASHLSQCQALSLRMFVQKISGSKSSMASFRASYERTTLNYRSLQLKPYKSWSGNIKSKDLLSVTSMKETNYSIIQLHKNCLHKVQKDAYRWWPNAQSMFYAKDVKHGLTIAQEHSA